MDENKEEKTVIVFDSEEEDDWIRSPEVTAGHTPDKDLQWMTEEEEGDTKADTTPKKGE